jgi:hypothetical protein
LTGTFSEIHIFGLARYHIARDRTLKLLKNCKFPTEASAAVELVQIATGRKADRSYCHLADLPRKALFPCSAEY